MTASLLLNIFMSAIKGHAENMSEPGLVSFGYIEVSHFYSVEVVVRGSETQLQMSKNSKFADYSDVL